MRKDEKGFSLMELLVVIALVGLFAALALGYSIHNKNRWSLRNDAREITSMFYQARQRASRTNSPVRLDFAGNRTSIWLRNAGAWEELSGEDAAPTVTLTKIPNSSTDFAVSPIGQIIDATTLAASTTQVVQLSSARGAGVDTITITFYPYGGVHVTTQFY